jgi:hypothetical protein
MSDAAYALIAKANELERRLEQTEVKEVPLVQIGTYQPTYIGLTTAGATTYTTQEGTYTRIGNRVFVNGRIVWTAATGTGIAAVSLPVAAVFTRISRYPVYFYPVNVTFANGSIVGVVDSGTSSLAFVMLSPATNAAGTLLVVEAAGDLSFATSYEVA